ncbi:SMI1/KNR4 family protein [Flavobacterium crocinum]|uniref:SMI1/KNR4 family protein n=1 Tax=Flavobacterium crocinum TaxID=2183896 RepID=A0A2S1YK34_9FLAO|nr:SMI1/KNR4 family protein [Flavobacterium crocinum]AWK04431.1 SMI1/KNR4 family protein [Flavobacterium crocinum]
MNTIIWNKWIENWNWILAIAKKRNWDFESIKIQPKIVIDQINKLEEELSIKYPDDFKIILTEYSSRVILGWQINDDDPEKEFSSIFSGAGGVSDYKTKPYLWDFDLLPDLYQTYLSWLKNCYNNPLDSYGKHYYNKIPFIEVPNGDLIAFNQNDEVMYLSHDDGPLHGEKLADNFIEFITLWSNLGCIGTESEQLQVFYDSENQKLITNDPKIKRWKNWLEK